MTAFMTAIFIILTSLGVPGLEESALQPSNPSPCSLDVNTTDGNGQAWGTEQDGARNKISNGF